MNYQINSLKKIVCALFVVAGLAACSDLNVKTDKADYHFKEYRSFAWHKIEFKPEDKNEAAFAQFVKAQLTESLVAKGYKQTDETPDFFVSYNIVRDEETAVKEINTYSGYGKGFVWRNEDGFLNDTYVDGKEIDIQTINKGTLVLDIIDVKEDLLVWRGTADKKYEGTLTNTEAKKIVEEAVYRLFQSIPQAR